MSDHKKWFIGFIVLLLLALVVLGSFVAIIDPYFHYHAPLRGLSYEISNQRYQNDGIVRHFEYDALIVGNSMTENFKTSEFDALFGVNSVKVPLQGASHKEYDRTLRAAFRHNDNIKCVLMSLNFTEFVMDKDYMRYDEDSYPSYLYDDNPFNDVKYLLSSDSLKACLDVLMRTRIGFLTTSFDEYSAVSADTIYGLPRIIAQYERPEASTVQLYLDEERLDRLIGNVNQNIIETAKAHPDVDFYYFFPPFSVVYWDKLDRAGEVPMHLEAEKKAIEMLLELDNVRIFSFEDDFEQVCNFDLYRDYGHYSPETNSRILECIAEGEREITLDNYQDYYLRMYEFYTSYDYEALFE